MCVRDTYFEPIHSDPLFNICAICGAPLKWETREQRRASGAGLCEECYQIHSHKTRHLDPPQKCPFPWMYHRCTLNQKGECRGAYSIGASRLFYRGIKWWITEYDRCIRDYEAIMELKDTKEAQR